MELEEFQEKIGYKFKNVNLLQTALTHTSYANENKKESNEKLEFLGDAVLEFVVSNYLFKNYHQLKEGKMTKVRATVVCEKSLHKVALKYNFGDILYLGKSEKKSGGSEKAAILADSVEAVIAAIYEDGGINQAEKFILNNLKVAIEQESKNAGEKDYKTVLQEELQKNGTVDIKYIIISENGPDHDKSFIAEVRLNDNCLARGVGKTKKEAEMQAAKQALENI
jgi:ribonuclease-3